jgi:hypothetical protein
MPGKSIFDTGRAESGGAPVIPGAADPARSNSDDESLRQGAPPAVLRAQLSHIDRLLTANLADGLHRSDLPRIGQRYRPAGRGPGNAGRD